VPDGQLGRPTALVRNDDSENKRIRWIVHEEEQARGEKEWDNDKLTVKSVLLRYAHDVAVSSCPTLQIELDNHHWCNWTACQYWSVLRLKEILVGLNGGVCIIYRWNISKGVYVWESIMCLAPQVEALV